MLSNGMLSVTKVFTTQSVNSYRFFTVLGVSVLCFLVFQCVSGIMLAFSLSNEVMLVASSRETEDMDVLYIDDFFWLHERGVDFIYLGLVFHFFWKVYQQSTNYVSESSWKSGSFMFLLVHGIIFSGLVLCCTHLSDITLKIAANIVNTLFLKVGSIGYFLYTDETLNTDSLVRIEYLHYILPFFTLFCSYDHLVDMHYAHRDGSVLPNMNISFAWEKDVLKDEVLYVLKFVLFFAFMTVFLWADNEPLSFEFFMWGDVGCMNDVRFLSVAPHWYFRPFMSFLIFCPHHYIGVFGLLYFFLIVFFLPESQDLNTSQEITSTEGFFDSELYFFKNLLFIFFVLACFYVCSYLPYGRFFTSVGGNKATTCSFIYIILYLGLPINQIMVTCWESFIKHKELLVMYRYGMYLL